MIGATLVLLLADYFTVPENSLTIYVKTPEEIVMVNKLYKRHPDYLYPVRNIVGAWVDENTVFRVVRRSATTDEWVLQVVGIAAPTFSSDDFYFKDNKRWIQVGLGYKNKRRTLCTK